MLGRGLLERGADGDDRRRHRVGLTRGGRTWLERLRETGERLEQEMLGGLAEPERIAHRSLLGKLHRTLETNPR